MRNLLFSLFFLLFPFLAFGEGVTLEEWAKKNNLKIRKKPSGETVILVDKDFILNEKLLKSTTPATLIFLQKLTVEGKCDLEGAQLIANRVCGKEGESILRIAKSDGTPGIDGMNGADGNPPGNGMNGHNGMNAGGVTVTLGNAYGVKLIIYARGGNGGNGGHSGIGRSGSGFGNGGEGANGGNGGNVHVQIIGGDHVPICGWMDSKREQTEEYVTKLWQHHIQGIQRKEELLQSYRERGQKEIEEIDFKIEQSKSAAQRKVLESENQWADFDKDHIIPEVKKIDAEIQKITTDTAVAKANLDSWRKKNLDKIEEQRSLLPDYKVEELIAKINGFYDAYLKKVQEKAEKNLKICQDQKSQIEQWKTENRQVIEKKKERINKIIGFLQKLLEKDFEEARKRFQELEFEQEEKAALTDLQTCKENGEEDLAFLHKASRLLKEEAQRDKEAIETYLDQLKKKTSEEIWQFNWKVLQKLAQIRVAQCQQWQKKKERLLTMKLEETVRQQKLQDLETQILLSSELLKRTQAIAAIPLEKLLTDKTSQKEAEEILLQSHRIFIHNHGGLPGISGFGRSPFKIETRGKDGAIKIEVISEENLLRRVEELSEEKVDAKVLKQDDDDMLN